MTATAIGADANAITVGNTKFPWPLSRARQKPAAGGVGARRAIPHAEKVSAQHRARTLGPRAGLDVGSWAAASLSKCHAICGTALKSDDKLLWSAGRGTDVWALMSACAAGNLEAVQALIAKDPSLARSRHDYRKPLFFAVSENRIEVVRFLLDHDGDPLDVWVDDNPVEIARERGYVEMEQLLIRTLEEEFNASVKGEAVAQALRDRDLRRMRELLDANPEVLEKGDSGSSRPITGDDDPAAGRDRRAAAARRGHQRQKNGWRGRFALTNGDYVYRGWRDVPHNWPVTPEQVMAHLKARGAFIDLPTACHTGDIERVRELLRQDPTLANKLSAYEGYYLGAGAPLSNAAAAGRMDIVRLLLDHGADPNLAEEQVALKGKALYSAVHQGHYDIAKLLLNAAPFRIRRSRVP